ncbi:hypothetical protein KP806_21415 [Paenibacillus sp. N4]|uniref:hypothetical protein n=1 Tax=Paenibacillus vietnamensis TaxID=2590547 RepID=UPI001CD0E936|nr:hypothetical protein [Paenibacillus vietnamensis]MCA0757625.1 hypothetical protein [Paenibacillus vietnamensis]
MDDWCEEIAQKKEEIDHILLRTIDELNLDAAYGIVRETSFNPAELPSWTIRIGDFETVLTPAIMLQYLSEHRDLNNALVHFLYDHFPYFAKPQL